MCAAHQVDTGLRLEAVNESTISVGKADRAAVGGIAEFAFPLIIGVLAGTYSTIYIASPIVLWWYRGERPATA